MKNLYKLLFVALLCAGTAQAQISVTGAGTALSTPVNAPAIVVDNSLTVTSASSFTGASVYVSANFNSGDVLSYTGTLPGTVTASYNSTTGVLTFTGTATAAQYETLLRTVTFATSSTNAATRTILFNLGSVVAYSANGHLYEFVSGSFSWTSAKTAAAARTLYGMTGYLTTITTAGENAFITQKLGADGWIGSSDDYSYINAATGATTYAAQVNSEGKWYWVTGPEKGTQFSNGNTSPTQLTYMNWNTSEPNNSGSNEHYGEIFASTSVGKWNDLPNTSLLGYVVEYGGLAGDPSVDVIHTRDISLIATSLRTTGTNNGYNLHATAITVDNAITVYSSSSITNATVTISSGFNSGDALAYTAGSLPAGVTGSYNATTGVLSFTGSATYSAWQALLRTVTFSSTSNVIGNRGISFSVGNLVSGSNGHFYEVVTPATTWATAKTNAAARSYLGLQGYLATITSQTENDFIQQKLTADGWIGASDAFGDINAATGATTYAAQTNSEGKWYWVTGPEKGTQFSNNNSPSTTQLTYMNWNTGEPNNSGSNENYAQIFSSGATGKWNDLSGAGSLAYIVEYGGLSTDPTLELSASRSIVITAILPVNGLTFHAAKQNGQAQLKWSTESESNTLRFDVLHSTDGRSFAKLGEVAAAQNSTTVQNYRFLHAAPASGTHYYMLQLFDRDGKSTYSTVQQLSFSAAAFTVVPNPVTNRFTVTNPFEKTGTLVVRNLNGAKVLEQTIAPNQSLVEVGMLPGGVYFATIVAGDQQSDAVKFIKK
ncbi:MAG TPA: lectin-like protein [Flavisolibacter sp.]|jgi:hypothetical protein|nr:lectin-like protein [Flavisolibacter sp.]